MDRRLGRRSFLGRSLAIAAGWFVVACGGRMLAEPTPEPSVTPQATTQPAATSQVSIPACVARPEQTEGPYFVDEMLDRSDIRANTSDGAMSEGTRLDLEFRVSQVNGSACAPLAGAIVDVWHCDAAGVYSDVSDPGFNTSGRDFLRGFQTTDASGIARFVTIYPGWYQGRTVHVHFKIRTDPGSQSGHEFTTQLYFDDALTDEVHALAPYAAKGVRTLRNDGDGIYRNGGSQLLLDLAPTSEGYGGTFEIGLYIA